MRPVAAVCAFAVCSLALGMPPKAEAVVFGTCSFTVASVAFGNYNPTVVASTTANGSVSINCIVPTTVTISLTQGSAFSYAPRAMSGTGGSLPYNLYTDAGLSAVWGDGITSNTKTVNETFGLFTAAVPVYGAIPPQQNAAAGTYSDTVTATATF